MPEECNSGAPLESRVAGFRGTVSQAVGVQCSVAAAAYRGDPTGDFSKSFLVGSSALLEGTIPETRIVWYVQIVFETAGLWNTF